MRESRLHGSVRGAVSNHRPYRESSTDPDIELALLDETGATVHAMPYPAQSWRDPASPLMYEIRKDGLDL